MYINKLHKEAELAAKTGDFTKALNLLTQAVLDSPKEPKLYEDMGVVYLHLQFKDKSIEAFDKALELDPNNPYRYSSRAFAKARFKDFDGAIADYEQAIVMDPEDAITRNNLGLALEQQGYYKKAEKQFKKSNDILGIKPRGEAGIHPDSDKMRFEFESSKTTKPDGLKITEPQAPIPTDASSSEEIPENEPSRGKIIRSVFTEKETFKEFIGFITSGFKLKQNDKTGKS